MDQDKRTNIFLLIDVFHSMSGGAERHVHELIKHISKERFNITVGCLSSRNFILKQLEDFDVQTLTFKIPRIYSFRGIRQGFHFARMLKEKNIDILITYHFGSDIWGTIFGKIAKVKTIISNRRDMGFWKKPWHIWAYRIINRYVSKIITVSDSVKKLIVQQEKLLPSKVSVIHNGVQSLSPADPNTLSELRKELGIDKDDIVIMHVANLKPVKGHKYLLQAIAAIYSDYPRIKVFLAGKDYLNGELQALSKELGISSCVNFLGIRRDVQNLLPLADICVLPSLSEGMSNTLLEYMAAGKPIIATDTGGNPEVVNNNINGLIVNPADAKGLADKLRYLLSNPHESKRLAAQAKIDAKNIFSIDQMVKNYEDSFETLNREANSPPALAVVLGMTANGLSVTRSLGRKGIPVIAIDSNKSDVGFCSRYIQERHIAPSLDDKENFLSFLISIGKQIDSRPVLFITADEYIAFISEFRGKLSPYYNFLLPSRETVECFLNKEKTFEFAKENNIPHPTTFIIKNKKQLEQIAPKLEYPCILKPLYSHIWRKRYHEQKVCLAHSREELYALFEEVHRLNLDVMIQQVIPGPDSNIYVYISYCNQNSQELARFSCRKLRQYPPHFGIGCLCESIYAPRIVELGRKIINATKYHGLIALEFKLRDSDKVPFFIEANMRTIFLGELPIAAGIDFPHIAYRNLAYGDNTVQVSDFPEHVKLLNLELDLGHLARMRKAKKIRVIDWIRGFKAKKIAHTYFAWDDLKPWIVVYSRLLKRLLKRLLRISDKR